MTEPTLENLEWRMSLAELELKKLSEGYGELRVRLDGISQTLLQIKFISIGIGLFYFADTIGLAHVLKIAAGV